MILIAWFEFFAIKYKKPDQSRFFNLKMVPEAGVEPARCCHRGILSPLRLPIPPPGHTMEGGTGFEPVDGGFADHSVSHFAIRPKIAYRAEISISVLTCFRKLSVRGFLANKKRHLRVTLYRLTGAEDEIRTRDPRLGKAMLYH
jgi:hypothetical protein